MRHSTAPPTAADVRRFEAIREHGCIACRMRGVGYVWPEIHHLTITGRHGGKRRGHQVADLIDAERVVLSENGIANPRTDLCDGREIATPAIVAYSSTDAQATVNGRAMGRESFDAWLDAQIGL